MYRQIRLAMCRLNRPPLVGTRLSALRLTGELNYPSSIPLPRYQLFTILGFTEK